MQTAAATTYDISLVSRRKVYTSAEIGDTSKCVCAVQTKYTKSCQLKPMAMQLTFHTNMRKLPTRWWSGHEKACTTWLFHFPSSDSMWLLSKIESPAMFYLLPCYRFYFTVITHTNTTAASSSLNYRDCSIFVTFAIDFSVAIRFESCWFFSFRVSFPLVNSIHVVGKGFMLRLLLKSL